MNRKNKAKILIASMLFTANTVMAANITITDITLKNDTVTVTGMVDEKAQKDMILYAVSDVDNPVNTDVSYAVQTKTNEEGMFEISFTMNEQHSASDGKYTVYAICNDAVNPAEGSFEHIGKTSRQIVLNGFNSAVNADDINTVIANNLQICNALGISNLEDVSGEYLANRPSAGYTDENFVSEYNAYVFVKVVNSSENAQKVKEYFDIFASQITNRDKENEDFIAKIIFNNKNYENVVKINEQYDKAVILSLINNSERNEILQNISDNASALGIEGDASLAEYKTMNEENKAYISKALVVSASNKPFESEADIITAIRTALAGFKTPVIQSGGNGGGGGGNNKGSSQLTVSSPEVGQKLENTIKGKFRDVSENFWGKNAIEKLSEKGIINGDGENFRPNDKISREEFVTIAVNAFKLYNADAKCDFYDVSEDAWYYKYVASAYENNIISGSDDGGFGAGEPITREDAATILARLIGGEGTEPDFSDSDKISDYAKAGVGLMQNKNIITGMPDGSFAPKNNCTRAEAAMMFYKILEGAL